MNKIDLTRYNSIYENNKYAQFKNKLSCNGIIPIYDMDKLYIYKLKPTNELKQLHNNYKENLSELYKVVIKPPVVDRQSLQSYLNHYGIIRDCSLSTDEELIEKFDLTSEEKKDRFLKFNGNYIKYENEETYLDEYRLETYDELFKRLKKEYRTFIFERPSKLASITSLMCIDNYYSLDLICSFIYELLYGKKIKIDNSIRMANEDVFKVESMPYTNNEKRLSLADKISTINDIISSIDIECIYSGSINELPYFNFIDDMKTVKVDLNRMANENSKILFDSEFKDTYNRVMKTKIKKI